MKLKKIILLMGAPGSGKGTQSKLLSKVLGFGYFSTGELSREYAKQDNRLGREIKVIVDKGVILPIDIIRQIFVKKLESLTSEEGLILDGYPRTLDQVELLNELMSKYTVMDIVVLFLNVDRDQLHKRLSKRIEGEGAHGRRADDDPKIIMTRFDEYQKKTAPVKDYYQKNGKLIIINGDQPIEAVHQEILEKLGINK
ncbi:MAG: nucleoside monophosphate kinase [Candidatus Doudnabacteria bacterium]|nr:nucleoside monophosphate kinase [Candidatus Doudnabacteria bacterium]